MKDEEMVVEEKALAMVDGFATEMYLRRFGGRLIHKWAAFDKWVYRMCLHSYHLPLFLRRCPGEAQVLIIPV